MNTTSRPDDFTPPLALPAKVLAYSPPDNPSPSMPVSRSGDIMSKSTNIPQNNNELINLGSHSATSGPTVQRQPLSARIAGSDGRSDVAGGTMSAGASGLLAWTREPRPADNQTPAISAAVSKNHSAIAVRSGIGELDIKLDIQSPLGQPSPRADNTEVIPVHNISSFEPSSVATLKEFQDANHGGVLNLHRPFSASPLELSSPPLPAITPPLSRNVQTRTSQDAGNIPFGPPKATEPGERDRSHSSQVDSLGEGNVMKPLAQQVDRTASVQPFPISSTHSVPPLNRRGISISSSISRAASVLTMIAPSRSRKGTARGEHPVEHPSELSHPRNEDKGKAYTNEQRPPSPRGHATATAESPSLPLPVFGPHLWDEIYPLIHGNEDVGREANGTAVGPTLDQERKLVTALDECATHAEDSDISYGARCRTAELSPSSDHTPDTVIPKRPPESLVGRMYSFNHSLRYDPNAPHLPETSEPREKLKRTPDSAPSLDRTESLITPPHPVLLPMQRQPNHAAPVPSNDELTGPNVYAPPQPPTVVSDSQARAALCPGPSVRSDRSLLEGKGETHPDTEIPLMQRPVPITTQPTPQECPSLHPSPRSSPLGDGQTEPEPPGQSGGDRKPEDRRTEDESIREAGRESPPLRKHGRQGGVKGRYLRAWKKYPCCCCIFHVLSFCYYLCSCGPCCD